MTQGKAGMLILIRDESCLLVNLRKGGGDSFKSSLTPPIDSDASLV